MDKYWFCVKHHAVEGPDGCPPIDRLGPYASRAEAESALALASQHQSTLLVARDKREHTVKLDNGYIWPSM